MVKRAIFMLKIRDNKNRSRWNYYFIARNRIACPPFEAMRPSPAIAVLAFVGSSFYFKYRIFWFFIPISVRKDTI